MVEGVTSSAFRNLSLSDTSDDDTDTGSDDFSDTSDNVTDTESDDSSVILATWVKKPTFACGSTKNACSQDPCKATAQGHSEDGD